MSESPMDRDFFHLLRSKIEVQPSRDFDRRFWQAFEKENSTRSKFSLRLGSLVETWRSHRLAFAASASTLAVAFGLFIQSHHRTAVAPLSPSVDPASIEAMMSEAPMLEQLDLLASFDDVTAISDDDWKVLLADT